MMATDDDNPSTAVVEPPATTPRTAPDLAWQTTPNHFLIGGGGDEGREDARPLLAVILDAWRACASQP